MKLKTRPSLVKWLALVVVAGLMLALIQGRGGSVVHAGRLARLWGFGRTGLVVQNIEPDAAANVTAHYYDIPTGAPGPPDVRTGLAPGAAWYLFSPGRADPARHAMIVTADRAIVALNRTQRDDTDAAVMYGNVKPSKDVAVPWVSRG